MPQIKYTAFLLFVILTIIFLSFFYSGITTKIPVSSDYILPISQTILSGKFLHLNSDYPFMYSPGSSNIILAMFILFRLPINLFGLLSWIFLFIACKKLGDTFGLNKYMAFIFAASFCTTTIVVRTIADQSIDKWLCTWFIMSLILLEKPHNSLKWSLLIGLSFGMLVGTKYSGPLFLLTLLPIYGKTILRHLTLLRFIASSALFTIFGLFWYIRNYILKNNPYYPANIPFFKGVTGFTQQDWHLWKIPIVYPQGTPSLINAFLSEYMIWGFSGLLIVWYIIYSYLKKKPIDNKILRVTLLSATTGFVSLFLPIAPPYKTELFHIISDMRYIYIYMVLLLLAVFLLVKKYNKNRLLATIALINAINIFSFIPYQPKIFVACILLVIFIYLKRPNILRKLYVIT